MLILKEVLKENEVRDVQTLLDRAHFKKRQKFHETSGAPPELLKNNLELRPSHKEVQPAVELIKDRLLSHFEFSSYAMPRYMLFFFNRYESGMFYNRHVDVAITPRSKSEMMRTDVSFTLFLTEPDDYEGGDFVVELPYGEQRIRGDAGNVILYPSDRLHYVEPVTRGARTSVVGWIESLISDPTDRQIHFDLSLVLKEIYVTASTDHRRRLENVRDRLLRRWVQT